MPFFARWRRFARAPADDLERAARAVRAGADEEAAAIYARALAVAPDDRTRAIVHNKRAVAALARGDRGEADAELARALAVYPACVPAIVNTANRLLEAGDVDGAIERYETAIRLDPDFPEAHHNLGVALKRVGRRAEAVRALRRATGLERRRRTSSW